MEFIVALCGIMMVNIVLSGDNAVVIALASRGLPEKQQTRAILWGSAGAIGLRVILTLIAVKLLQIPYLQCVGGILLIWIAAKLVMETDGEDDIEASASFLSAVKTIVIADLVMSLDNTLAIAAVAKGNYVLLTLGLLISIPMIVFGSQLIVKIMERFPLIVYAGAGLIAWTAGEMMQHDKAAGAYTGNLPAWLLPVTVTAGVIVAGVWHNNYRRLAPQAVEDAMEPSELSD